MRPPTIDPLLDTQRIPSWFERPELTPWVAWQPPIGPKPMARAERLNYAAPARQIAPREMLELRAVVDLPFITMRAPSRFG
jgi:hypothetical protein